MGKETTPTTLIGIPTLKGTNPNAIGRIETNNNEVTVKAHQMRNNTILQTHHKGSIIPKWPWT
jgi:hypothetical protein